MLNNRTHDSIFVSALSTLSTMYNDLFRPYITGHKAGTTAISMLWMRRPRTGMGTKCDRGHSELKQGCLLQTLFPYLPILPPAVGG